MAYPGITGTGITSGTGTTTIAPIGTPQRVAVPSVLTANQAGQGLTIPTGATSALVSPDTLVFYTMATPPTAPTNKDFQLPGQAQLSLDTLIAISNVRFSADVAVNTTAQITVQFFG
jgi:hypothetical protein